MAWMMQEPRKKELGCSDTNSSKKLHMFVWSSSNASPMSEANPRNDDFTVAPVEGATPRGVTGTIMPIKTNAGTNGNCLEIDHGLKSLAAKFGVSRTLVYLIIMLMLLVLVQSAAGAAPYDDPEYQRAPTPPSPSTLPPPHRLCRVAIVAIAVTATAAPIVIAIAVWMICRYVDRRQPRAVDESSQAEVVVHMAPVVLR